MRLLFFLFMEQLGYPIDESVMQENIQQCMFLKIKKPGLLKNRAKVVGCIAVALTHYFHRFASFLRVIALVVDNHNRRSGIGKDLLGIAERFALQNGCSHIELTSGIHRTELGSHDFYRSLGYTDLNNTKKYFAKKL